MVFNIDPSLPAAPDAGCEPVLSHNEPKKGTGIVPFDPHNTSKGIVSKIRSVMGTIARIFFRYTDPWDVDMGIEHMARGKHAGMPSPLAMRKTIASLK